MCTFNQGVAIFILFDFWYQNQYLFASWIEALSQNKLTPQNSEMIILQYSLHILSFEEILDIPAALLRN